MDELCKKHNLTKYTNYYEIYHSENDNYLITLSKYSHPQFEEVRIEIEVYSKKYNDVISTSVYEIIQSFDGKQFTLPDTLDKYVDDMFDMLEITINSNL
jgi:hypothetical protein